jgi:hypothetical protein
MLRCRSIASLRRTVGTPPLIDFSRVSPLELFERPARGFFQHPAREPEKVLSAIGNKKPIDLPLFRMNHVINDVILDRVKDVKQNDSESRVIIRGGK